VYQIILSQHVTANSFFLTAVVITVASINN